MSGRHLEEKYLMSNASPILLRRRRSILRSGSSFNTHSETGISDCGCKMLPPVESRLLLPLEIRYRARFRPTRSLAHLNLDIVAHLIEKSLEKGLNLQTWTPVTSVTPARSGQWHVNTSRGVITASTVVYATNGAFLHFIKVLALSRCVP